MEHFEVKCRLKIIQKSASYGGTCKVKPTQKDTHEPILTKLTEKSLKPFIYHYRVVVKAINIVEARTLGVLQAMAYLNTDLQHE